MCNSSDKSIKEVLNRRYFCLVIILLSFNSIDGKSQGFADSVRVQKFQSNLGLSANVTDRNAVPLWMRSNQYGSTPLAGISTSVYGNITKNYQYAPSERLMDWAGVVDFRLNVGNRVEFIPVEAYLKGRLSIFELKVGRSRDREGLVDSLLSSGSFTLSGNALGVPSVRIGIPDYWSIPYTAKWLALKGNASYGWMGNVGIRYGENSGDRLPTNFHHLSFYGRVGKPDARWRLYGAIHHDVIWGSDQDIFGDQYNLGWLQEFWHVVTGKSHVPPAGYEGQVDISKVGNHLGSIDLKFQYDFSNLQLDVYRQFFYEKGAIAHFANLRDGLTGVALSNRMQRNSVFHWKKILAEVFYSKHQAGDYGARWTPSGPEYYYNHAVYPEGFSYRGLGLGTPLIIPAKDARDGLANHPSNYFISNRVVAGHVGAELLLYDWNIIAKGTFARHYGDFRTSGPDTQWFNGKRIPQNFSAGMFTPVNQFSAYLEGQRNIGSNIVISGVVAGDYGKMLNNSLGIMLKVNKLF